ncbi:MAG: SprB repeat-containing protein, partial [Bacteroidota bacterium]
TGLAAGDYSVTVTDANDCSVLDAYTVGGGSDLEATTSVTDVACSGQLTGAVDLTVNGTATPFTFLWSNDAITEDLTDVPAGTYSVTITDANGCTKTVAATVGEPAALNLLSEVTDVGCSSLGAITLTAEGGTSPYLFVWADGITGPERTNLEQGEYLVVLTDAAGCEITETISVGIAPEVPQITLAVTDVSCRGAADGRIIPTIAGGTEPFTYAWSDEVSTAERNGLEGGRYTLNITDATGCTTTATVEVSEPEELVARSRTTAAECVGGGAINLLVSGGTSPYRYAWSTGQTTEDLTDINGGDYFVDVTDANGCTTSLEVSVAGGSDVDFSSRTVDPTCPDGEDGAIFLDVTDGTEPITYRWSNGASTKDVTGLAPGVYTVEVTDGDGCVSVHGTRVRAPESMEFAATVYPVSCVDGAIDLTVTGGTPPYVFVRPYSPSLRFSRRVVESPSGQA